MSNKCTPMGACDRQPKEGHNLRAQTAAILDHQGWNNRYRNREALTGRSNKPKLNLSQTTDENLDVNLKGLSFCITIG